MEKYFGSPKLPALFGHRSAHCHKSDLVIKASIVNSWADTDYNLKVLEWFGFTNMTLVAAL